MARYLEPRSEGKKDWMSYVEKRKTLGEDRKADEAFTKKVAERKEEKLKK